MKVKLTLLLLLSLLLLSGCAAGLEEAMQQANINYRRIVHVEETDAGSVVFYEGPEGLNAGLIAKNFTGWKWVYGGGSASFIPPEGLSWVSSNIGPKGKPFPLFYGVIANPQIAQVRVIDRQAKIVDTGTGLKIWFVILNRPVNPPVEIRGLSKHGKVLFEYGQ